MHHWNDEEYVAAFRDGGDDAVNRLMRTKFPDAKARVVELERMEKTGDWDIFWHYSSRAPSTEPDFGTVRTYRGDR